MKKLLETCSLDNEDNFEWTESDFAAARPIEDVIPGFAHNMATLAKKMGRPRKEQPKVQVSLRIDADILAKIDAQGPGRSARVNDWLRQMVQS